MPDSDVTLSVRNVTKRFGDFSAVEDLSFDVRPGRVFGFLGPNGAGKTTTIRMIVGITAPDEGSIDYHFEGNNHQPGSSDPSIVPNASSLFDRIGYLPEERG